MVDNVRSAFLAAYQAALAALDPERVTNRALADHDLVGDVSVIAIGKAAPAMARGAASALGNQATASLVISDHYEPIPDNAAILRGSHPLPDEHSEVCAEAAIRLAEQPADNVLFLVSGGGSALAELPLPPLTLRDVALISFSMMSSGVPIGETNTVRRHISAFKNGGLLARTTAPRAVTLVISDVIDGPASDVASGPTLRDDSTAAEAYRILDRFRVLDEMGPRRHTADALHLPRTLPEYGGRHEAHIIADRHVAAAAATRSLVERGLTAEILQTPITTDAIAASVAFCAGPANVITIATGEPTMMLDEPRAGRINRNRKRNPFSRTRGGRSQSAALAAALELEGGPPAVFAALGTDGVDGPTDAAGAIVDHTTAAAIRAAGLDPEQHLRWHNAYPALDAADALVKTGPTGTNVADIWFFWRSEALVEPIEATA